MTFRHTLRPVRVVAFDVNGTLSDLSPLGGRFAETGAPPDLVGTWFASVLRDGFALGCHGEAPSFADLAEQALPALLTGLTLRRSTADAASHVMAGFRSLPVHADVPTGVRGLRAAGLRLVTLTNGSSDYSRDLLARADLQDSFEAFLAATDSGRWKPAGPPYVHAAARCGVAPHQVLLAASHPWDIDGAARMGWHTAWINRAGAPYPTHFRPPDLTAAGIDELASQLTEVGRQPEGS